MTDEELEILLVFLGYDQVKGPHAYVFHWLKHDASIRKIYNHTEPYRCNYLLFKTAQELADYLVK